MNTVSRCYYHPKAKSKIITVSSSIHTRSYNDSLWIAYLIVKLQLPALNTAQPPPSLFVMEGSQL